MCQRFHNMDSSRPRLSYVQGFKVPSHLSRITPRLQAQPPALTQESWVRGCSEGSIWTRLELDLRIKSGRVYSWIGLKG